MAAKPKGGRGNTVPYETKLVRVPRPLADQVSELVERYQEWIAGGGDPQSPPPLLDCLPFDKPVNQLSDSVNRFSRDDCDDPVEKPDLPMQPINSQPEKPVNNFAAAAIPVNKLVELEGKVAQCQDERDKLRDQLEDQAARAGEWYDKAKEAQRERDELEELNHVLTTELDKLKEETQSPETSQQLPDLEAVRDRVLSGLRVGKQASEYKRTKAAIDRFIAELRVAANSAVAEANSAPVTPPIDDRTNLTWDAKVNSFLGEVSRV